MLPQLKKTLAAVKGTRDQSTRDAVFNAESDALCAPCVALFQSTSAQDRECQEGILHHLSGTDLRDCARTESCRLCALLWTTLRQQEQADICTDYTVHDCEREDGEHVSVFDERLFCRLDDKEDSKELRFSLPILEQVLEAHYGSSMPRSTSLRLFKLSGLRQQLAGRPVLQHKRVGVELSHSTVSPATVKLAKEWIKKFKEKHAHSSSVEGLSSWLPTRLIDVGTITEPVLKLTPSTEIPRYSSYFSLSHRWGTKKIILLKKGNIESLMVEIPDNELSQTFRDAITFARMMDARYIWIDSLCIIQDSKEDWSREAATMADVYARSTCNLSAIGASEGGDGLFFKRNLAGMEPLVLKVKGRKFGSSKQLVPGGTYLVPDAAAWQREIRESALHTRGWVYQERTLSSRIIHFGLTRVYFECIEIQASEDYPEKLLPDLYAEHDFKTTSPLALESKMEEFGEEEVAKYAPSAWDVVITQYLRCDLTYASDRQPAIAGVARRMAPLIKSNYILGLWESHLVRCLLWSSSDDLSPTPAESRCPSWSFLSIDSPARIPGLDARSLENESRQELSKIVDFHVKHEFDNIWTGEVLQAWLRIRGCPFPVTLAIPDVDTQDGRALVNAGTWKHNPILHIDGEPQRWAFRADSSRLSWEGEFFALCLQRVQEGDGTTVEGLVLNHVGTTDGVFRRAGYFTVSGDICDKFTKAGRNQWPVLEKKYFEDKHDEYGEYTIKIT
ncbi:putative Heterokaryon incompatibility domain-containing protein [Seiridium cardinale]